MDPEELRLLNETLTGLAAAERAGLLTAALDVFGWRDVLAAHPEEAIAAPFDAKVGLERGRRRCTTYWQPTPRHSASQARSTWSCPGRAGPRQAG